MIATVVVNDEKLREDVCKRHEPNRKALELAPAASKVVERIRSLRAQRPKELEPLWNAMQESGTISTSDCMTEVCRFDSIRPLQVIQFPATNFGRRKKILRWIWRTISLMSDSVNSNCEKRANLLSG
jgi:hypothetical protein